jgi:hypothetical protein
LLPTHGAGAWLSRFAAWAAFPLLLWVTRFPLPQERDAIRAALRPGAIREALRAARAGPTPATAAVPEAVEQEIRDEDRF